MYAVSCISVAHETAYIKRYQMLFEKVVIPALTTACLACSAPLLAQERIEIPLSFEELPADLWSKNRLAPERTADGLRLRDTGTGAFDDASFWQITFEHDLPFGRKMLSLDVTIEPSHQPLWGTHLFQPIIDGNEANPALGEDGTPSFENGR